MKKKNHILLLNEWEKAVWALSPERFEALMTSIETAKREEKQQGFFDKLFAWNVWRDEEIEKDEPLGYSLVEYEGNTYAFIRFEGLLVKNVSYWAKQYWGAFGTADLIPIIDKIENDPNIHGLIGSFNTAGGTVEGAEIFAERLFRFSKPSVALVDEQCESAGFWYAAQFGKIIATTKTAQIGSIGILMRHLETSKYAENEGYKVTYVTNEGSEDKILVTPETPLTPEGREYLVGLANPIYETFVAQIRKSRRTIADSALTGKTFLAAEALELGLIDQIGSQETALAYLAKKQISKIQNTIKMESSEKSPVAQATAQAETPPAVQDKGADMMAKMFEQMTAMSAKIATLEAKTSELDQVKAEKQALETKLAQSEQTVQTVEKQKAEAEKKLEETPVAKIELPSPTASDSNDPLSRVLKMAIAQEGRGSVQARWNGYRENAWNKPQ